MIKLEATLTLDKCKCLEWERVIQKTGSNPGEMMQAPGPETSHRAQKFQEPNSSSQQISAAAAVASHQVALQQASTEGGISLIRTWKKTIEATATRG